MPRRLDGPPDQTDPYDEQDHRPYADAAVAIGSSGLGWPIPIPFGEKAPPPVGSTGKDGSASEKDITAWRLAKGGHNVAISLGHGVVGIDVDDYDGKGGGETLADLERDFGALPPTWVSSSRNGSVSGIRLFRVDPELTMPTELGAGIDVIQHDHRYLLVAPSRHPSGQNYAWRSPEGISQEVCPKLEQLPELPSEWQDYFADLAVPDMHSQSAFDGIGENHPGERERRLTAEARRGRGAPGDLFNGALDTVERVVEWLRLEPYLFHSPKGITVTTAAGKQDGALLARRGRPTGYKSLTVLDVSTGAWPSITVFSTDPEFIPPGIKSGRQYDPFGFAAAWAGHDPSDPDELRVFAREVSGQQTEAETELPDAERDEWEPIDLTPYLTGDVDRPVPAVMTRTDGYNLLYPAKLNVIFGQPEAGKSWIALAAATQIIKRSLTTLRRDEDEPVEIEVIWLDYEDSPGTFVDRIRTLSRLPALADVVPRIRYFQPPGGGRLVGRALVDHLEEHASLSTVQLVVIDSYNEALYAAGLDPLLNKDVGAFSAAFISPLERATKGAILVLDHTTKADDGTTRHALGAQTKLSGVSGAQFHAVVSQQPTPNQRGYVRMKVTKDRHGAVRKHSLDGQTAALVIFEQEQQAPPDGSASLHITFTEPVPVSHHKLRREITTYLHRAGKSQSLRQIRADVTGKNVLVKEQINVLVDEGFVRIDSSGTSPKYEWVRDWERSGDVTHSESASAEPVAVAVEPVEGPREKTCNVADCGSGVVFAHADVCAKHYHEENADGS